MSKVLFCTVPSYTDSTWLNNKLLGITHSCQLWWADNKHDVIIVENYTDLNKYLLQAEWLVVQTAGDVIVESNHLQHKLANIPDDIGLIGHLVWYPKDETPHLHPQCFILRTDAVHELFFEPTTITGPAFFKSFEDLHQGHAPAELFLDSVQKDIKYGFGTDVIAEVLRNSYRVVNFDTDWRFGATTVPQLDSIMNILKEFDMPSIPSRGYCFPELHTKELEHALRTLDPNDQLDPSQRILIELFRLSRDLQNTQVVHVLNWDNVPNVDTASSVVCTAGGFLAEAIALNTNATRIVLYDINKHTLDFKRALYTEWDGKDYFEYAQAWADSRGLLTEPYVLKAKDKALDDQVLARVLENWNHLKTLDIEYVHLDIIQDLDLFVSLITDNSVVHTSTILTYYLVSVITHTSQEIELARTAIKQAVEQTNSYWSET